MTKEEKREYNRRWREAHPDYDRDRMRGKKWKEYFDRYRKAHPEVYKKWILANPEKVRVHQTVDYAKRSGKLTRQPCQVCGVARTDAHHEDYAKPLEVTWLCRLHHKELHKAIVSDIEQKAASR